MYSVKCLWCDNNNNRSITNNDTVTVIIKQDHSGRHKHDPWKPVKGEGPMARGVGNSKDHKI